jgi:uncharacterized protein (DUF58 family)
MVNHETTGMGRFTEWLERHWVNPAYAGWVLLGLAIFFFAAATNTLAGWLYVMSGVLLALLVVAAALPARNLRGLTIHRLPTKPVSAGESLVIELQVHNAQSHSRGLLQVIDQLPKPLGPTQRTALRAISPGQTYTWRYQLPTSRRGIYHWSTVGLRSAAPLGLFWCRRELVVPAKVVVYPQVLPLQRCPLLDALAEHTGPQWHRHRSMSPSAEGMTRSLRPYRWGDSTRLIHWRTSARYGDLRVRELEKTSTGQEVIIAVDTSQSWLIDRFEQAVVAAASLYTYATHRGLVATLWQPPGTILQDKPGILYALADLKLSLSPIAYPSHIPTIWLTTQCVPANTLAPGSRQVIWSNHHRLQATGNSLETLWIDPEQNLQTQLQQPPQGS